jgi:hypothetical protein
MLIIRPEQLKALEEAISMPQFERMTLARIRPRLPDMSEQQIVAFIRDGARLAAECGATDARGYGQFIELMLLLGRNFLNDPQHAWAPAALSAASDVTGNARIGVLVTAALEHLRTPEDKPAS